MVTPNFPPDVGGVQTYSYELANQLAPRCEAFVVLAPWRAGGRAFDRGLPYRVVRAPAPFDNQAFSGMVPVSLVARRHRLDTAFATHWSAAYAAMRSLTGWPKRTLCAAHGKELLLTPLAGFAPAQSVYDAVRGRVLAHADRFACVSNYTAQVLIGLGVDRGRVSVVPNGVDPAFFRPGQKRNALRGGRLADGPRLLTVARLVRRKGIDRVIQALPKIAERLPAVEYVVVGDGPDRERLRALAQAGGVTDRIRWMPDVRRDELVAVYNACDLFVLPASGDPPDVEGFGLAILEASACGLPAIGSSEGGIPDAIVHGETGLTIDLQRPNALEDAVVTVMSDPDLARRMGRAGRRHTESRANWTRSADGIVAAIQEITPRAGRD